MLAKSLQSCLTLREPVDCNLADSSVHAVLQERILDELKGKAPLQTGKLKAFMDDLLHGYEEIMSGDLHTLFKMKEVWVYLGEFFPGEEKMMKKIKKANSTAEYKAVLRELWGRVL